MVLNLAFLESFILVCFLRFIVVLMILINDRFNAFCFDGMYLGKFISIVILTFLAMALNVLDSFFIYHNIHLASINCF